MPIGIFNLLLYAIIGSADISGTLWHHSYDSCIDLPEPTDPLEMPPCYPGKGFLIRLTWKL
jgi:hypothetical protein